MINLNQLKAAQTAMLEWLSSPEALGKAPARLEYGCVFSAGGMNWYAFRYKEDNAPMAPWMMAVCGGFEGGSMESTGQAGLRGEYCSDTAAEDAAALAASLQ